MNKRQQTIRRTLRRIAALNRGRYIQYEPALAKAQAKLQSIVERETKR